MVLSDLYPLEASGRLLWAEAERGQMPLKSSWSNADTNAPPKSAYDIMNEIFLLMVFLES